MHSGTGCAQCHTEVQTTHARPCDTIESRVDCAVCHADQVQQYQSSTHGQLAIAGDPEAPTCVDCHDNHATEGHRFPSSPTFSRNEPQLCAKCHREGQPAARRSESKFGDIVDSYEMSIHGHGLVESGLVVSATCSDCHSAHAQLPAEDPESTVHPENVAGTCGTCHHGIEQKFRQSIHWPGNAETDRELPTCEDCHTSHGIKRTDQASFRFEMMDQCGRCHEPETTTFFDTIHGKASQLGDAGAAKCYDCHGTHGILPNTHPESELSTENIVATCGDCHPGSHRRFVGYLTHATHHDPERYPFLFWSFWAMTSLLVGTLTFALLHTAAWLWRLWRTRDEWQRHQPKPGEKLVRRFTRGQRTMHLIMLLSFFLLALTGMVLKFSYMTWAQALAGFVGGFETTGVLHRIGAVVLFGVFIAHLVHLAKQRKRKGTPWLTFLLGPDSMMFGKRDLIEFWGSLKWFLGKGERPRYGRFTYWEKFDYFAVFWGVFIIGSTGLILWFPELFTRVIPGRFVNVATIIHSDEALLAVGFIFTVHFFNTHFRPDKFPMDPVIFTGRVPLEELKHDKPREYEALVESGELEERMVDPVPRDVERSFKIFGFVALGIGLALIRLIVYTLIVAYT